jgi:hypothetical protein
VVRVDITFKAFEARDIRQRYLNHYFALNSLVLYNNKTMSGALAETNLLVRYGYEVIRDRRLYDAALQEVTDTGAVEQIMTAQSLTSISAMGLLAKQAYDIACGDRPDRKRRQEAARLGCITLLASDVIDDEVDRREMPLEEKDRYLDAVLGTFVEGTDSLPANKYPYGSNPHAVRASFDLARYIHTRTKRLGGLENLNETISPLVRDAKRQLMSDDTDEQLDLVVRLGGGCWSIAAMAVEITEQGRFPDAMDAAFGIGGYAGCLDNACEIDEDVAEGSKAYATTYLSQHGDTAANRRIVRARLLETADRILEAGTANLTPKQSRIVKVQKRLIDLRYKRLRHYAKPPSSLKTQA